MSEGIQPGALIDTVSSSGNHTISSETSTIEPAEVLRLLLKECRLEAMVGGEGAGEGEVAGFELRSVESALDGIAQEAVNMAYPLNRFLRLLTLQLSAQISPLDIAAREWMCHTC